DLSLSTENDLDSRWEEATGEAVDVPQPSHHRLEPYCSACSPHRSASFERRRIAAAGRKAGMGGVAVDRTIDNIAFRGGVCDFFPQFDSRQPELYHCHGFFTQETGSSIRVPQTSRSCCGDSSKCRRSMDSNW
ncbi:unnamed protein product, partial [Brassica rapa subsp. trilocularis]